MVLTPQQLQYVEQTNEAIASYCYKTSSWKPDTPTLSFAINDKIDCYEAISIFLDQRPDVTLLLTKELHESLPAFKQKNVKFIENSGNLYDFITIPDVFVTFGHFAYTNFLTTISKRCAYLNGINIGHLFLNFAGFMHINLIDYFTFLKSGQMLPLMSKRFRENEIGNIYSRYSDHDLHRIYCRDVIGFDPESTPSPEEFWSKLFLNGLSETDLNQLLRHEQDNSNQYYIGLLIDNPRFRESIGQLCNREIAFETMMRNPVDDWQNPDSPANMFIRAVI